MPARSSTLPDQLEPIQATLVAEIMAATRIGFVSAMAWSCGPDWDMGGQPKPDCYLVTVTSGAIAFGWDELRTLTPGQLALAPTGAPLQGWLAPGCPLAELIVIHAQLDTDWGPSLPALASDWIVQLPDCEAWLERLRKLVALAGHAPAAGRRHGEHLVASLLGELLISDALHIEPPQRAYDPRVAAALRAIRDDPRGELSSDELAEQCGLRPVRFRELFREALGVSPKRYQLNHRLDLAARRLLDGRARIGTIAEELGFANQPYFQSCFKQRFGCTPREHRLRGRGV